MVNIQIISQALLDTVSDAAQASPRQRKNHNFHLDDQDICHRLLNALEPGTYIPPHRHLHASKAESIVILRGRVGVLFFDSNGAITQHCVLQTNSKVLGVDIPPGTYHSLVALTPQSVFFEAKAGPYVPISGHERAAWAPAENTAEVVAYLARMKEIFL